MHKHVWALETNVGRAQNTLLFPLSPVQGYATCPQTSRRDRSYLSPLFCQDRQKDLKLVRQKKALLCRAFCFRNGARIKITAQEVGRNGQEFPRHIMGCQDRREGSRCSVYIRPSARFCQMHGTPYVEVTCQNSRTCVLIRNQRSGKANIFGSRGGAIF